MQEFWRQEANYLDSNLPEVCSHTFYAPPLTDNSTVIDLGGSTAAFSHALAATFGCRCHVVEATSYNIERIQESDRVKKYHLAISGSDEPVTINLSDEGFHSGSIERLNGINYSAIEKVKGIKFESFLNEIGCLEPDLVKVDIEGAEIEMFDTATDEIIRGVGQFTVEFHDFLDISHTDNIRRIIKRLKSIGFLCFVFTRKFHGDVMFVNSKKHKPSLLEEFAIRRLTKYSRGMRRVIRRIT